MSSVACRGSGVLAILAVLAMLAALVISAAGSELLRCRHERCRYVGEIAAPQGGGRYKMYEVDGNNVRFAHGWFGFVINCNGSSVLESAALPRAEPALRVWKVSLQDCPLPAAGSLAGALAAVGVTLACSEPGQPASLSLYWVPLAPVLAATHFAGLECLLDLNVRSYFNYEGILGINSERGFLAPLRNLRSLSLTNVIIPAGELDAAPPSLRVVQLREIAGVEHLSEALYSSPTLRELRISTEGALDAVAVPPGVQQLEVESAATTLRLGETTALEQLVLARWTERRPAPLQRCDALRELRLIAPALEALPAGWLANCSRLQWLVIDEARHLTALPPQLLVGATALRDLSLSRGVLEALPPGLLQYAPNLRELMLTNNRLRTLPSGMFAVAQRLRWLYLASNELDAGALHALAPLERLDVLVLANNSRLGDACDPAGYSPIRHLRTLTTLFLSNSGVTRVCRDWLQDMPQLQSLDLSHTQVSELTLEELQFLPPYKENVLHLEGSPLTALTMSREYFNTLARGQKENPFSFALDSDSVNHLECDCRMYWVRRAGGGLQLPALSRYRELRCPRGRWLRDVPPGDMTCAAPERCAAAALPAACACAERPDDDPSRARRLVLVRCPPAPRAPHLPADTADIIYRFAGNENHYNATELQTIQQEQHY